MEFSPLLKQMIFRISAIVMVKAIGLIGRISLTRLIGPEGIGLYQIAYSFFGLALMIITGGLPTSLALYTAKYRSNSWIWFKMISFYVILSGGIISATSFFFSAHIAHFLGNHQIYYFIRCLAPALFTVSLLSLLRGYLQGLECYNAIAISEVIEQSVRVTTMLIILFLFLDQSPALGAGKSMLGAALGAISAYFMLIIFYIYRNNQQGKVRVSYTNFRADLKWFFHSSFIIFLTRLLIPLSDVLEAVIIPNRLQTAGYSIVEATSIFGIITGMALLVVYMPTMITAALTHTLTMKMAADWQGQNIESFNRRTRMALEASWVWGCTSSLFIYIYSTEISVFLFNITEAAEPIRYLSVIPLIVGLREVSTSILWAQDRKKAPLVGLVIGICIASLTYYFLIAAPGMHYKGASIGILLLEVIAVGFNIFVMLSILKGISYVRLILDVLIILFLMFLVTQFTESMSFLFSASVNTILGMLLYLGCSALYILLRFKGNDFIKE